MLTKSLSNLAVLTTLSDRVYDRNPVHKTTAALALARGANVINIVSPQLRKLWVLDVPSKPNLSRRFEWKDVIGLCCRAVTIRVASGRIVIDLEARADPTNEAAALTAMSSRQPPWVFDHLLMNNGGFTSVHRLRSTNVSNSDLDADLVMRSLCNGREWIKELSVEWAGFSVVD